ALLATTAPPVVQDGLQSGADAETSNLPETTQRDQRTDDGTALQDTQQAQSAPLDLVIVPPTASAEIMMFAVVPESATATELDEFADTASDALNQQAAEEQAQQSPTAEALRFADEPSQSPQSLSQTAPALTQFAPPSMASGAVDNAAGAAASNPPGEAAQPATPAPEVTSLPTDKPSATASPTASPTSTETRTLAPSLTPFPIPTPVPVETVTSVPNTGLVLIVIALLLLGVAVVTTILRRRGA
ncbi:MAG: hypothetical protein ABI835_08240, partial [Chloroflexota bacterium]